MIEFLGKEVRGRFGLPSGVIATNSDTAGWMIRNIPQIGFFNGKSTTIEPRQGYDEDILTQPTPDSLWNAVGYANPGLEAMVESFRELKESTPDDVFLMPQIGESSAGGFEHCVAEFDRAGDAVDGIELNLSCPHVEKGGILIGSDPESVHSIVSASRKATRKPLIVKLNAGVHRLEEVASAAADAGADALSAINSLGGPNPELSNQFGGLSGAQIFPATLESIRIIRKAVDLPFLVMGGIKGAADIRRLQEIDDSFFFAIGSTLGGLTSNEIRHYFNQLEIDLAEGTDLAAEMTMSEMMMEYSPFVVSEIVEYSPTLRLIRFHQNLDAGVGQFVFLKLGSGLSKPFSVASDRDHLELVIRKVGKMTARSFDLKPNDVVRINGPFGRSFKLPAGRHVIFVGAGVGIAPILHAAEHHDGPCQFVIGSVTESELVYLDEFREIGEVAFSTDDGSAGHHGLVTELLEKVLDTEKPDNPCFYTCGPEIAIKGVDEIVRRFAPPEDIFHLVERMTSCGIGICGKCSISSGERACVDGPVFTAAGFSPGGYLRDRSGAKTPTH